MTASPWTFAVFCHTCHYAPIQGDLLNLPNPMLVPEECPKCVEGKEEGPPKGASRLKQWVEVRRLRRALRAL